MNSAFFVAILATSASHTVFASESGPVYEGCYEVKSGYVETLATTLFTDDNGILRQQGTFSVTLKNSSKDRPESVSEKLQIKLGTVVGEFAGTDTDSGGLPILEHTLTNDDRSGVIVSYRGVPLLAPTADPCVFAATESLEEFEGYGAYINLDADNAILVEGDINVCTGQNTFEVTEGELCFTELQP